MRDEALSYARRGWRVFPLQPRDKRPAVSDWTNVATTEAAQIRLWWDQSPTLNAAIATGPESGLVVVDIDIASDGDTSLEQLAREFGPLPPTYTVKTGTGGWHYYFLHPGEALDIRNSQSVVAPGIDVRGWHGYVAAPPSIHPNGQPYEVVADIPLAPLPGWLLARIVDRTAQAAREPIKDTIPDGERHRSLLRVAGAMRNQGCSPDEILVALRKINERCTHPKTDGELSQMATSTGRWAAGPAADADAQPTRKRKGDLDGPALQAVLEEAIPRWLRERGLTANAIGAWVASDGRVTGSDDGALAIAFANHFRRSRQYVTVGYIGEILGEVHDAWTAERRAALVATLLRPVEAAGDDQLARWVEAVTGLRRPLDIGVLRHWIWLVKRSLADLPCEHHLMPILYGPQDSGKSTAVRNLMAPLVELALSPAPSDALTDSRWAKMLSRYVAGFWDEMEGADKANLEALKRTITAATAVYRPMRTNDAVSVPMRAHWIGASNKPVAAMIRDTTGNRRFYEMRTLPRIDWDAIGAIDYAALWASVDHTAAAPILAQRGALKAAQSDQRYRDNVALFAEMGHWGTYRDDNGRDRPPVNAEKDGVVMHEMQARYRDWCRDYHEEPVHNVYLGQRLQEEGFTKKRDSHGTRQWRYFLPVSAAPLAPFKDKP